MSAALVLLLAAAATASPPESAPALPWPPAGASWTSLQMQARKGLFRGSVAIEARRGPADGAAAELRPWPEGGARLPDGEVAAFDLRSRATFRGEGTRRTLLDHRGLLQDTGREGRRTSVRRFGLHGMHQWKEKGGAVEEKHVALDGADGRPIIDLSALLWLATGLRLDREGALLQVAVVSKGRVVPLDLRAGELATLSRGGAPVSARRVLIASSDDEQEATLFGLRGDVELFLDTATGLPLELRGSVAKLGPVTVRVTSVEPETD